MQYIRKMCILRQLKQGFSGDGKTLSGLIKAEQYGKHLAVEVSVINFAPLRSGEYYCLLADSRDRTELLRLRGKSIFNVLSEMDIENGFCAVICFVQNELVPIAYGVNGNRTYDWKRLVGATLPPAFNENTTPPEQFAVSEPTERASYDDESIAQDNYYRETENEQELLQEIDENAPTQSPTEKQDEKSGLDATQNETAPRVLHAFTTDGDAYYQSVKTELDELFETYPKDDTLNGAFSCSRWARVKGEAHAPEYLVGVVYAEAQAKYICYALRAKDKDNPPEEIKEVCAFVPTSPFREDDGFFVIFQSATTGECLKPFSA